MTEVTQAQRRMKRDSLIYFTVPDRIIKIMRKRKRVLLLRLF